MTESIPWNICTRFANLFRFGDDDYNCKDGGGIHNHCTLDVNDCTIVDNRATRNGGGIYTTSGVNLSFTTVKKNLLLKAVASTVKKV